MNFVFNRNEQTHLLISVANEMCHRLRLIREDMPEQYKWCKENLCAAEELYNIYKKLGGKGDYSMDFQLAQGFINRFVLGDSSIDQLIRETESETGRRAGHEINRN